MELLTLDNGLRIALQHNDFVRSTAMNLYIDCGSRNETESNSGSAHFLEHMMFKGTENADLVTLNSKMDQMGGQFNAYTSKEHTCVFCHVLKDDVKEALSMILEMVTLPVIDKNELETEKGVILEEINMYEDSPEDIAAETLYACMYRDGLKNPVLGTKESVKAVTVESLKKYREAFYTPDRMVLSVCGNFENEDVLSVVEKYISPLKRGLLTPQKEYSSEFFGGIALREKDFEQTQLMIASESYPAGSENRFAMAVLSAIAGGNSSSRLNMRIREELGLAYSIYSGSYNHRGAGAFVITAGTAHKNQAQVIEETLSIMDIVHRTITPEEIERVKAQFKATTIMGHESISAACSSAGREILYRGTYTDIDTISKRIDEVDYEKVMVAYRDTWNKDLLCLTAVGKPLSVAEYEALGFKNQSIM